MKQATILVVEDEAIVAADIGSRLEALGYTVAGTAGSGEQAIALAEKQRPSLVLMDIQLQGSMDGITAARTIHDRFRLPIVFLTAYAEDTTLQRAKLAEPFGYILKPFEDRELKTILEMALYKHRADEEIRRLNRLYAVLSQVNQAVVRIENEGELFDKICRIAIEFGNFKLAWIGWIDPETKAVRPIAAAGEKVDHLSRLFVSANDQPEGRGVIGTALRTGAACVSNDYLADPRFQRWHALAAEIGKRSIGAFPIRFQGEVAGALMIYSGETNFFQAEEIKLLEEVALDISFALDRLESEIRRRRAEELNRQNQALFLAVIEGTSDAIYVKDLLGRFLTINTSLARIAGKSKEQVLGQDDRTLMPLEDARQILETDRLVMNSGTTQTFEEVIHFEGRRHFFLTTKGPVFDARGELLGLFGVARDITERKQLEEQLLQAHKMEAIGQLAGGVAHDFNNVLAAMLMNLYLLRETPNLEHETAEGLKELEKAAQHAASLTRQLLMFSRRQRMDSKRLDVWEVLRDLLKMLRRLLGEHIEIASHKEPDLPLWVEADPGMLEQVVMNLCVNARDAMPKGGRLTLSLARVEIEPESARRRTEARVGRFVCLSVADTGCGMDETVLQHVFEPFYTTKEVGQGTGLGLATVYGIVKQHEGWIEVESAVGLGTTFRIYLPAVEAGESEAAPSPAGQAPGGTETLLVVEDDEDMRRMVTLTLSRFGYEVIEARNGVEAVRLWEQHGQRIALLLTDMVMPEGMTGLDLAERLRQLKPDLKIIVSSGYSVDLLHQGAGKRAGVRFLAKPYQPTELARTIRAVLDSAEGQAGA